MPESFKLADFIVPILTGVAAAGSFIYGRGQRESRVIAMESQMLDLKKELEVFRKEFVPRTEADTLRLRVEQGFADVKEDLNYLRGRMDTLIARA